MESTLTNVRQCYDSSHSDSREFIPNSVWMREENILPLASFFLLFICMCISLPLSRPASSNWLDGRQCVCVWVRAFPLPRPHPFSRCIDVCVYPFFWLFSLTSLMNVCVFHCATFLAFSYSVYCRLCFTTFLLLPLAPRLPLG